MSTDRLREAGFSLLECLVAGAVLAIGVGGSIAAMGAFGRFATHQAGPVRVASQVLAEQTLRTAQDAWKYSPLAGAPSGTWTMTVPIEIPGSPPTSAPVTVRASTLSSASQSAVINVSIRYTPDPNHSGDSGLVSLTGAAQVKAPVPGSSIVAPSPIPQPSGAP